MLKSVPSVPEAVLLIKNIRDMCAAGGFRLTKFVSNSKEVLLSIPEADRRQGISDKELLESSHGNERAQPESYLSWKTSK